MVWRTVVRAYNDLLNQFPDSHNRIRSDRIRDLIATIWDTGPKGMTSTAVANSVGWQFRKKITLNHAKVGANLTNFTVHIPLRGDIDIARGMRGGGEDIYFTLEDGTTKIPHAISRQTMLYQTTEWIWFTNPRVVYYHGAVNAVYWSWANRQGHVGISQFNLDTGITTNFDLYTPGQIDDHNNASIVIRPDGRVIVFYSQHSVDAFSRYRISTNPEDVSTWQAEQTVTQDTLVEYSNAYIMNGYLYFFFKTRNAALPCNSYRSSADMPTVAGASGTFGALTPFLAGDPGVQRPYIQVAPNPANNRFDFLCDSGNPAEINPSIFHFYALANQGVLSFFNTDGTPLTAPFTPPASPSSGESGVSILNPSCVIYDGTTAGTSPAWNWDIIIDQTGNPCVLFTKFVTTQDQRYMFSRLINGGWMTPVEICRGGTYMYSLQPNYSGGMSFFDENTVYVSTSANDGNFNIERWVTANGGLLWSRDVQCTNPAFTLPPPQMNVRPVCPRPAPPNHQLDVLYIGGIYNSIGDYDSYVGCYPPIARSAEVLIPNLSTTLDTKIYCYYGNPICPPQENPSQAWDANTLYVMDFDLQPGSLAMLNKVTGAIAGNSQAIRSPTPGFAQDALGLPSLTFLKSSGNNAIDLGLNTANFANRAAWTWSHLIVYDNTQTGSTHSLASAWPAVAGNAAVWLRIDPATADHLSVFAVKVGGTQIGGDTTAVVPSGVLSLVSAVYDATNVRAYINGVVGGTTFASGAAMSAGASPNAYLGRIVSAGTNLYGGTMSRSILESVARSATWLTTLAANLTSPFNFMTFGAQAIKQIQQNSYTAVPRYVAQLSAAPAGSWTPTLTAVSNVDAVTAYSCMYTRIGDVVSCSGRLDIDPTAASALQVGLSLPIPTTLTAVTDVAGVAASNSTNNALGILGDTTNMRAVVSGVASGTANVGYYFNFQYRVK